MIMLPYRKPVIRTILFFSVLIFYTSGCRYQSSKEQQTDPAEIVGEVDIPDLPEDVREKNNIEPLRAENPSPKNLKTNNFEMPADIESELPDFSTYSDVKQKKQEFFEFIRPIIEQENQRVLEERSRVLELMLAADNGNALTGEESQELKQMAEKYRLENLDIGTEAFFRALLLHVDIIPEELALVQAANESAWGSSYFARKGNNLFGRWCFTPGCGVVPRKRMDGATHEVAVYNDLAHSVRSYIHYLNSHPAFRQLRVVRYHARETGQEPSGFDMAIGLQKYSGIGMEYVKTLRSMMRHNLEHMGSQASL